MTCASCQHHVEEALRATAGVESAHVDLMAHRASVVFDPAMAAPEQLVEAIRGAGYDAVLPRSGDSAAGAQERDRTSESARKAVGHAVRRRGGHAAGHAAGRANGRARSRADASRALALCVASRNCCAGFCWLLTAVVVVWAGRGIYLSAIRALRHGATNMNTLVGLGTGVAFLYSALCHAVARARTRGLL